MNQTDTQGVNLRAKQAALAAIEQMPVEPTGLVNYQSKGRVIIIGDETAAEIAPRLSEKLHAMVILTQGAEAPGVPQIPVGGREIEVDGFLGDFKLHLNGGGKHNSEVIAADLILDLSPEPLIKCQLKPPGYIHTTMDEVRLQQAIDELSGLTGSFEKPRYFNYDPDICAHGHAGITACSRCIDACPADAIVSLGEKIAVTPHLCQGGGACATVCPSGALRYTYPTPRDNIDRLRKLLSVYRQQGGSDPVVVLIAESDSGVVATLAENQLPFLLEELASVGLEIWLTLLAYGAKSVLLVAGEDLPVRSAEALRDQLRTAREILTALGYAADVLCMTRIEDLPASSIDVMPDIKAAAYSGVAGKRQTAYLAIDHLYVQAETPKTMAVLSQGAPFGKADVDGNACTLCFSCVAACPAKALQTGGEGVPQLRFIEENCLQCSMCVATCPEDAITITPRLLLDVGERKARRQLYTEPPFLCSACGKPFATRSVIDNMLHKLADHYMFQDERARRRLTMCEDCRVIDIVQDPSAIEDGVDSRYRQ